ncbi:DUF885 domain-containing protein [Catenovulum sp. SM1970]|uniref:DUF885 domain-containing protein n=1 Tax=Marinifaba aquimaris TaxID=2741323 RepID=UPI001574B4F6|nr:DUF885 domain-containing protein [Marinifaba aquimaris]NTS77358.1 DUF885 domain-containing protein [Marinifaba aquimaris]
MLRVTAIATAVLLATACSNTLTNKPDNQVNQSISQSVIQAESAKANALFDAMWEESVNRYPQYLSALGRKKDNDKWNDLSDSFKDETIALTKAQLVKLESIDETKLDAQTQTSLILLKQKLANTIEDDKWRHHGYPVNQMYAIHTSVPTLLLNQHKIDSVADAHAYIARLNGLPNYFRQVEQLLQANADKGVMTPKFVFAHVIRNGENIIKGAPISNGADNTIFADFKKKVSKLDVSSHEKKVLVEQAEQAMVNSFAPAYRNLVAYLKKLEAVADTKDGVWKLPDGDAFYKTKLARITTTDLSAKAIHEIGLAEVARIHDEMRAIKEKVGFEGDLKAFMQFMCTDEQFYYPNTAEGKARYLKEATAYIDNMVARLDELFITKPKAELVVKAVEPFREQSAGKAFYSGPAEDGSRPGIYYANLYDMKAMPIYQMEALAYHEGAPGHHMQIALQQELENMPKFRKFGRYTAYTEGWGLYTEYMPKEIGMYEDPYSDFGRLAMELWRACRLVVDTGIHAMKWTREEGIDYYVNNTPNAKSDAVKMVERHIVMPGQATAYKIGMIKILELREDARKQLGDKFDIRQFHEVVLQNGPVPLNVLAQNIQNWVDSKG